MRKSELLLILIIPCLILLTSFYFNVFNFEVSYGAQEVLSYLKGDKTDLGFLTERELLHLKDVKNLLDFIFYLFYIFIFVFIFLSLYVYKKCSREKLFKSLLAGGVFSIVFLIFLASGAFFVFDWIFLRFHLFAFSNDFWILPMDSVLIDLFPEEFFYDMFMKILVWAFGVSFGLVVIAWALEKNTKPK